MTPNLDARRETVCVCRKSWYYPKKRNPRWGANPRGLLEHPPQGPEEIVSVYYPAPVAPVNNSVHEVSASALSFYRWLCRWHAQTGEVYASTPYLARKQGRSERTVYRWLSELRGAGCIAVDVEEGVQRSITPLVPLPPRPLPRSRPASTGAARPALDQRRAASSAAPSLSGVVSGVLSGVVSGVLPKSDAQTQDASTQRHAPEVVASLAAEGVTPAVAVQLLSEVGPEEARKQLEALPHRKPRDRAAVLVKSIRERWDVPRAYVEALDRKRKEAQDAQNRSLRAALEAKRAEQRSRAETALSGLSEAAYAALEARAVADLAHSVAWRMAQARPGGVAADKLLRAKVLELAAEVAP